VRGERYKKKTAAREVVHRTGKPHFELYGINHFNLMSVARQKRDVGGLINLLV
jgi:hypothetical protein